MHDIVSDYREAISEARDAFQTALSKAMADVDQAIVEFNATLLDAELGVNLRLDRRMAQFQGERQ